MSAPGRRAGPSPAPGVVADFPVSAELAVQLAQLQEAERQGFPTRAARRAFMLRLAVNLDEIALQICREAGGLA